LCRLENELLEYDVLVLLRAIYDLKGAD
jgi:hypothetical protein